MTISGLELHHIMEGLKTDPIEIPLQSYSCNICTKECKTKKALRDHRWRVHSNIKHECDICKNSYTTKRYLIHHIESTHEKIKKFPCSMCDYTAAHFVNLKAHINSIHLSLKHPCKYCTFQSNNRSGLKRHIDSLHKKLRNYKCPICSAEFTQRVHLNSHLESIHQKGTFDKEFSCPKCDFKTNFKKKLYRHNEYYHSGMHKCDHCEYSGRTKGKLRSHIEAVHEKIKNHVCDLCPYETYGKRAWMN